MCPSDTLSSCPSPSELERFLATALDASARASQFLMQRWRSSHDNGKPTQFALKQDGSPVTSADVECQQLIVSTILERYPTHGVKAEESSNLKPSETSEWQWTIDPIDATTNFVRGLPFFSVDVALFHQEQLVVGVSTAPALGQTAHAVLHGGAFLNGKPIRVSATQSLDRAYVAYGGIESFQSEGRLEQLKALCGAAWTSRGFGDSWSYHWLASGALDVMVEARTNAWDIAAVALIVSEAGGRATTLQGDPIRRNARSIVATNGHLHDEVLCILQGKGGV